jgi:hypothetical protein
MMNGALAGLVILLLGDSHMAGPSYLISSLHEALEAQGATVDSYGMCGASAEAWMQRTTFSCGRAERHGTSPTVAENGKQEFTWLIGDLLAKHHPNLVIVEAADAIGGYGTPELPKAWIYDQVHALASRIKGANAASGLGRSLATPIRLTTRRTIGFANFPSFCHSRLRRAFMSIRCSLLPILVNGRRPTAST